MSKLRLCLPVMTLLLALPAQANELCQSEFTPLAQAHQETMKRVSNSMPKGKPQTIEQAIARAQSACSMLGTAVSSFQKLDNWLSNNQAFCQIPDKIVSDVKKGLANTRKNQAQACGVVGQLRKAQASGQTQARQGQDGVGSGGGLVGGQRRNDPFSMSVTRKPQLNGL